MPDASPAEAAVDLHNQLIHLPYSEQDEIGRITWKLRRLHSRNRHDPATAIALVEALSMSGEVEEAADTAELIWGWRDRIEPQFLGPFVTGLMNLGMYDRSIEIAGRLDEKGAAIPEVAVALLDAAVGIGDVEILQEFADPGAGFDGAGERAAFLNQIRAAGLETAFGRTQRAVARLTQRKQAAYSAMICVTEEGPELSALVFVLMPREQRRDLEQTIDDAVDAELSEMGLPPGSMIPLVTTTVLPHTARWAPRLQS